MNKALLSYLEFTKQPWGKMFYNLIWMQLPEFENKTILDFGSGFGISAEHYSKNNKVIAVEPNKDMIRLGKTTEFKQITGGIEILKQIDSHSFDVILCHNVIEYIDDRNELFSQFERILKTDGMISIVKHNRVGRILQKIVLENDVETAAMILKNNNSVSEKFGEIKLYDDTKLSEWSNLKISEKFGIGAFYSLQPNDFKKSRNWFESMLNLEMSVSQQSDFYVLASFHHIILTKQPVK